MGMTELFSFYLIIMPEVLDQKSNNIPNVKKKRLSIKKILLVFMLLFFLYFLNQLIIFSFFAESKIVRISYEKIVKSGERTEVEWKLNYLNVAQYTSIACEESSYLRYRNNQIEFLHEKPRIPCWASDWHYKITYLINYNNVLSPLMAIFSNNIILEYSCKENCIIDSEFIDFIKFGDENNSYDIELNNLNYQ